MLLCTIAQIITEDGTGKQWEIINSNPTGEELRHNWFKAEVSCTSASSTYNEKRQSLLLLSLPASCCFCPDWSLVLAQVFMQLPRELHQRTNLY